MKDSKAGLSELKTLWQAAAAHARDQRESAPRAAKPHAVTARTSAATATTHATSAHEDAQLFRRAMQSVTPLGPAARTPPANPRRAVAAPNPEQLAKRQAALGLDSSNPPKSSADAAKPLSDHYAPHLLPTELGLAWYAPDIAADTPRRLQRGLWPVTARLDLHGLRTDAARSALTAFIADCIVHRVRCVRIIHGLGHGSANATPVLKEKVPAWLTQHPHVCAYVQAPASGGGKGALLALLRAANNQNTN